MSDNGMKNRGLDAAKAILDSLSDEKKKEAAKCKNLDEFKAFLDQGNIELPDEKLDAVSGGGWLRDLYEGIFGKK